MTRKGWIQTESFNLWFDHFTKHTKPTADDPVILVLDGHQSHTRNMDVIEKARQNHVTILCLPPHSTAKMQPLDVGFIGPFKTYYAQEISTWLRNHPFRILNHSYIGKIFNAAYEKAATVKNAANAFRKTGLFPVNRNVFDESDFIAHSLSNADKERPSTSTRSVTPEPVASTSSATNLLVTPPADQVNNSKESPTMFEKDDTIKEEAEKQTCKTEPAANDGNAECFVGPEEISTPPTVPTNTTVSSRAGRAEILTSSPYKKKLEESLAKKVEIENKKRKSAENKKATDKEAKAKKTKLAAKRKTKPAAKGDNCKCLFCKKKFSSDKHGETWAQCIKCHRWAHEKCGAVDAAFTCPPCTTE